MIHKINTLEKCLLEALKISNTSGKSICQQYTNLVDCEKICVQLGRIEEKLGRLLTAKELFEKAKNTEELKRINFKVNFWFKIDSIYFQYTKRIDLAQVFLFIHLF